MAGCRIFHRVNLHGGRPPVNSVTKIQAQPLVGSLTLPGLSLKDWIHCCISFNCCSSSGFPSLWGRPGPSSTTSFATLCPSQWTRVAPPKVGKDVDDGSTLRSTVSCINGGGTVVQGETVRSSDSDLGFSGQLSHSPDSWHERALLGPPLGRALSTQESWTVSPPRFISWKLWSTRRTHRL